MAPRSIAAVVLALVFSPWVAAQSLFWTQNGNDRVQSSSLTGGTVTDLTPTLTNPWGIDYANGFVYFTEDNAGKIWRMATDGSNRTLLASGLNFPRDIVANSTHLYWVNISGSVFRSNLDGSSITTIATSGSDFLQGIALSGDFLYWTNATSHTIQRSNLDGTGVTTLVSSGLSIPYGLQVSGSFLYWADLGTDVIQRSNLDGTGVTTLISAFDVTNPSGILVTDTSIYFTQQNLGVYRADLNGGNITQLASGGNDFRFIATDATLASVPEPSTWALIACGLGLAGFVARRRRCGAA